MRAGRKEKERKNVPMGNSGVVIQRDLHLPKALSRSTPPTPPPDPTKYLRASRPHQLNTSHQHLSTTHQVRTSHHIQTLRVPHHPHRHRIHQHLIPLDVRELLGDPKRTLVPQDHTVALGVGFGDQGEVFSGAGGGELEGPADEAVAADCGGSAQLCLRSLEGRETIEEVGARRPAFSTLTGKRTRQRRGEES